MGDPGSIGKRDTAHVKQVKTTKSLWYVLRVLHVACARLLRGLIHDSFILRELGVYVQSSLQSDYDEGVQEPQDSVGE